MPVTIEIARERATVNNHEWTSTNPNLVRLLTSCYPPLGISPSIPDPDLYLAQLVTQALGGIITDEGTPPAFDPNVVY